MLQEYRSAVEEEDYSKAAELRDVGAAGLPGWWVAENKDDPKGHLLHVVPGFSRYVGYAFSPKDLARAEVQSACSLDICTWLNLITLHALPVNATLEICQWQGHQYIGRVV